MGKKNILKTLSTKFCLKNAIKHKLNNFFFIFRISLR